MRGLTEQEKRLQARALNFARRHLDYAAKKEIIADELKENPNRSNNWIAKSLGVDDKTVASVRREMQSTSEIPKLGYTLGSDGKYQPATRGVVDHEIAPIRLASEARGYLDLDDEEGIPAMRLDPPTPESQNGSRRSRSDDGDHALCESTNVAVPSFTAIAST